MQPAPPKSMKVPKRVLICDDSDAFRKLEATMLKPLGYEILHAGDGIQGLKHALESRPDLVLLDVQMPNMDGVQVLAFLKNEPRTRDIPVVVITTLGREPDRQILVKGGASHVLSKPINGMELVRTVRTLLGEL